MKKVLQLAGLSLILATLVLVKQGKVYARITGTQPTSADIFCVGPGSLEVCVDASANLVPTTSGVGSVGTSSLPFNNLVISGSATLPGASSLGAIGTANTPGTGISSFGTVSTVIGPLVVQKKAIGANGAGATNGIYVSTTIPVLATYQTVLGSGTANVVLSSVPNISTTTSFGSSTAITDGTILILSSTSPASGFVLQDKDTLSGSGLQLGAATRAISADKVIVLMFNAGTGFWDEVSYGGN